MTWADIFLKNFTTGFEKHLKNFSDFYHTEPPDDLSRRLFEKVLNIAKLLKNFSDLNHVEPPDDLGGHLFENLFIAFKKTFAFF